MKIVKNNKRISVLGLIKFLAAIAIVFHHICIGARYVNLYILVEFFFFVSGYFTFKHFRKKENCGKTSEEKAKIAFSYTVNKFKPFIPFVLIAVILKYIILLLRNNGGSVSSLLVNMSYDALLLNSQTTEYPWALWYLSAMFIIFPIFCYMCQTRRKYTLYIPLFTSVIIYYFNYFNGDIMGVKSLLRAFFGMSTGILVYAASTYIHKNKSIKKYSPLPLVGAILSFALSILCLYPTFTNSSYWLFRNLYLISTATWLSIILSQKTIISHISSPFMNYLERLSMIIYILHMPIITIIKIVSDFLSLNSFTTIAICIISSIAISAAINEIYKAITMSVYKQKHINQ